MLTIFMYSGVAQNITLLEYGFDGDPKDFMIWKRFHNIVFW